MVDFLKYFFGKGDTVEFTDFTLAHFLPIVLAYLPWYCKDKKRAKAAVE